MEKDNKSLSEEEQKLIQEAEGLIKDCDHLLEEIKEMEHGVDFLINEYKTNKRYFRDKPGRVTIEDVIKTAFELGWASKGNFDNRD